MDTTTTTTTRAQEVTTTIPVTTTTTTTAVIEETTPTTTERSLYLYEFVDQFSMTTGEKSFYERTYNKPAGVKKSFSDWSQQTKLSK